MYFCFGVTNWHQPTWDEVTVGKPCGVLSKGRTSWGLVDVCARGWPGPDYLTVQLKSFFFSVALYGSFNSYVPKSNYAFSDWGKKRLQKLFYKSWWHHCHWKWSISMCLLLVRPLNCKILNFSRSNWFAGRWMWVLFIPEVDRKHFSPQVCILQISITDLFIYFCCVSNLVTQMNHKAKLQRKPSPLFTSSF